MDVVQEIKDWAPIVLAAAALAIAITPEQKKQIVTHAKRVGTASAMIAVIGFSLRLVYDFLAADGMPSRIEIFLFSISLLNTFLYSWSLTSFLKKGARAAAQAERLKLKEETQQLRERVLAATIERDILRNLAQITKQSNENDIPPNSSR